MTSRPDIVEVLAARGVELRPAGRELVGLCPLHNDRRPSLKVNADKQVWFCNPCGVGGDVFELFMRLDGLSFSDAKKALGVETDRRPPLTPSRRRAAERAASWTNGHREKIRSLLDDRYEQRDLADEAGDFELAEFFDRELIMLRGFYDAAKYSRTAAELLAVRESIEQITQAVEIVHEPPPALPPLTPEYLAAVGKNSLDFSEC